MAAMAVVGAQAAGDRMLANLRPGHPRLIISGSTWDETAVRQQTNPSLQWVVQEIERDARAIVPQPPLAYHKVGRRLLQVSRDVEARVLRLAAAYRLTGDRVFLRRAQDEMLNAAAFTDWNPSHFLDVAEMTAALALGYDWLYQDLTPAARSAIRDAIVTKGLRPGLATSPSGWRTTENNWNQVCFGGLILGALAVGDEVPEEAEQVLTMARREMSHGLQAYAPDGVYPEGPGYWSYGTSYSVLTAASLQTALGSDWGLADAPGFLASAGAFVESNGPSGLFFNYSDCGENGSFEPILFWFAQRTGNAALANLPITQLRQKGQSSRPDTRSFGGRLAPLTLVWWPKVAPQPEPVLPLGWHGDGPNPIAVFRSSWTDRNAMYLALKGGSAGLSHAHMDAGSFVYEADGVRWARDLGMQDYESLESKGVDLWNRKQNSQRWTVFRLNNHSHNTLTIDGALHHVTGDARIIAFSAEPDSSYAAVDLSSILAGQVRSATRGYRLGTGRDVLVQDDLTGLKSGADVCWTMATAALVQIEPDNHEAVLSDHGHHLTLQVLSPGDAHIEVAEANPPPAAYDAPNPGRRLVRVHATAPHTGAITLAVWLEPGAGKPGQRPEVRPIVDWGRR